MNRRTFMAQTAGISALAAVALPLIARAQAVPGASGGAKNARIESEIGNNHGHVLDLDVVGALVALQKARAEKQVVLNIQGTSRHPHTVVLSFDDLVNLLSTGQLATESSLDAGHTHEVVIRLVLA